MVPGTGKDRELYKYLKLAGQAEQRAGLSRCWRRPAPSLVFAVLQLEYRRRKRATELPWVTLKRNSLCLTSDLDHWALASRPNQRTNELVSNVAEVATTVTRKGPLGAYRTVAQPLAFSPRRTHGFLERQTNSHNHGDYKVAQIRAEQART